jgi:hypothetical protein
MFFTSRKRKITLLSYSKKQKECLLVRNEESFVKWSPSRGSWWKTHLPDEEFCPKSRSGGFPKKDRACLIMRREERSKQKA